MNKIWKAVLFVWSKRSEWSLWNLWRLIQRGKIKDSVDYLVNRDLYEGDLDDFESAMTAECIKQGLPMVFIQPGSLGHEQSKKAAVRAFVRKHNNDAPYHPNHPRDF